MTLRFQAHKALAGGIATEVDLTFNIAFIPLCARALPSLFGPCIRQKSFIEP